MKAMASTTVSISDELRRELLKVAAELQAKIGEKVDYDRVIRYILSKAMRNEASLRQACAPVTVTRAEVRKEIRKGRSEDRRRELALERRYS